MAPPSTPNPNSTVTPGRRSPLVPPEASIFVRYSPHHELPLSLTTSAAVHAVCMVLVITGVFAALFFFTRRVEPPPLGPTVEIGGGGDRQGEGPQNEIENSPAGPQREAGPGTKEQRPASALDRSKAAVKFEPVTVRPEEFPELAGAPELLRSPTDAMKRAEKVSARARKKLMDGLESGNGAEGAERGVRRDNGPGTRPGVGPGPYPGRFVMKRQRRALRWTLLFETRGDQDYLRQIVGLSHEMSEKPIIAIPQRDGEFLVFRDVDRPNPVGRVEDIGSVKRIYWVGDEPDSVADIARSLRLRTSPPYFVVFLPLELENELLKLELDYAQRHGRNREEEIRETRFKVLRKPGGACEPVVYQQR